MSQVRQAPVSGRRVAQRLAVDWIACDGRGLCAELLPEVIALDDWGFPMIRGGDLPVTVLESAVEAVRLCPRLALSLDHPSVPAARATDGWGREPRGTEASWLRNRDPTRSAS